MEFYSITGSNLGCFYETANKKNYWFLLVALALIGVGMLATSFQYSWHAVSEEEILGLSERLSNKPRDVRWRQWHEERAKMNGPRTMLNDTGIGLVALAATLALLFLLTGFPLRDARAPKRRLHFMAAYLAVLAVDVPASFWHYSLRQARFEYPTWGDSIIIGVIDSLISSVALAVVGSLFWLPFLAKARFPAPLFAWPPNQRLFNWVVSVGFGTLTALCLINLPAVVQAGNIGGIVDDVVFAYLFLSVRAGLIMRKAENSAVHKTD